MKNPFYRNALIQRVQRHSTMAVLFRSLDDQVQAEHEPSSLWAKAYAVENPAPAPLALDTEAVQPVVSEEPPAQSPLPAFDQPASTTVVPNRTQPVLRRMVAQPLSTSSSNLTRQMAPSASTVQRATQPALRPEESLSPFAGGSVTTATPLMAPSTSTVQRASQPALDSGEQPLPPTGGSVTTATPLMAPSTSTVQRATQPALRPEEPPSPPAGETASADPAWRRLQAIYRKHQEKASGGNRPDLTRSGVEPSSQAPPSESEQPSTPARTEVQSPSIPGQERPAPGPVLGQVDPVAQTREGRGAIQRSTITEMTARRSPPVSRQGSPLPPAQRPVEGTTPGNELVQRAPVSQPPADNQGGSRGSTAESIPAFESAQEPFGQANPEPEGSSGITGSPNPTPDIQRAEKQTDPPVASSVSTPELERPTARAPLPAQAQATPSGLELPSEREIERQARTVSAASKPVAESPPMMRREETTVRQAAAQPTTAGADEELAPYGVDEPLARPEQTDALTESVAVQRHVTPLHEVWSVQRLPAPSSDAEAGKSGTTRPEPLAAIPDQFVQSLLQEKPTAQPTQSAIELLPPRRPRPVLKPTQQAEMANTPTATSDPPSVQRAGGQASEQRLVETEIGALPSDLWELIGQRPPAPPDTYRAEEAAQSGVAHTETTGPAASLQAQPSPQAPLLSTTSRSPLPGEAALPAAGDRAVQRTQSDTPPPDEQTTSGIELQGRPLSEVFQSHDWAISSQALLAASPDAGAPTRRKPVENHQPRSSVQREPSAPSAPPANAATAGPGGTPGQNEMSGSSENEQGPNVDELAQKVYSNIKKRLMVEWERLLRN